MNAATPNLLPVTIPEYLEQLRRALAGADPALVQDALYDAEEYLRSEWAEHPELSEPALLASIAGSYGAPSEVADIYRDTEATVAQALRAPPPPPRRSFLGKVFGVFADGRAYGALLYMLLSLVTGTFYFSWVVTGVSLSVGLAVLGAASAPMYGYQIAKRLEQVGEGVLAGKQSALYPVLRNLESAGLLESFIEPSMAGPPRRYYRITEAGREVLRSWCGSWNETRDFVDHVLQGTRL